MSSQPNQSLIDGIRCFQELTTTEIPLGTKDIAMLLDINITRANRLLQTLKSIGMVEQNPQKKYLPGPAVHLFAAQSFHSSKLFRAAINVAVSHSFSDKTLAIGLLWGEQVVYMYHARPEQESTEGLGGYRLNHISNSSIGQALLTELSDEDIERTIKNWKKMDQRTIQKNLKSIRKMGYAINLKEDKQIQSIAMVFSIGNANAAIAFADFQHQDIEIDTHVAELKTIKDQIEALGTE